MGRVSRMTQTAEGATTTVDPADLDPQALADLVATLPGWPWADGRVRLDRISSGLTNVNWRMTDAAGTHHFLKVPGRGTRAFIDRFVASVAASVAAANGVGPAVEYFDDGTGIEVTAFLEGYRSATAAELGTREGGVRLMTLYRRLHAGELLPVTKTVFDMIDEHLAQVAASPRTLRGWQQDVVDRWRTVQDAYLAAGVELVPGHNDMLPSNYMLKEGEEMQLIDYDYAANTERAYEPGGIITLYLVDDDVREAMLHAYYGPGVSDRDRARVRACGIATAVKWGLWGLVNAGVRPTEDFDFERYGCMHLMHAAQLLAETDLDAVRRAL
jgi:thiamine kinase-like enzyme